MITIIFTISTYLFIGVCLVDFGFALRNAIKLKNQDLRPLAVVEMLVSLNVAMINTLVLVEGMMNPGEFGLVVLLVYRMSFIALFLSLIARRYLDMKMWAGPPKTGKE